jgi:hypothetical protein
MNATQLRLDHLVGCAWFWAWALIGFGFALGAVSLGLFAWVPVLLIAVPMTSSPLIRRSAFGVLTGAGALCLLVAWLQRSGQYLDPQPWLALGLVLVVAGLTAHAVRSRRDG